MWPVSNVDSITGFPILFNYGLTCDLHSLSFVSLWTLSLLPVVLPIVSKVELYLV